MKISVTVEVPDGDSCSTFDVNGIECPHLRWNVSKHLAKCFYFDGIMDFDNPAKLAACRAAEVKGDV